MAVAPLVSVILPVHDRAAWIARAITSVLDQTYPAIELIVVDDGSTDDTPRVAGQFGSRVTVLRQERAGPYAARNLGIRAARGDLVAFVDSDDAWLPDRLSRQVPLLERPEVGLVFGNATLVGGSPEHLAPLGTTCFRITPPRRGKVAAEFVWGNFVPTSTVLVRRRCVDETGGFSLGAPLSADYLQWFRIALRHELDYTDDPVSLYTVHPGGISQDLGRSLRARIQLFSAELACTSDAGAREVMRQLLFNLALHLGWATLRGRAGPLGGDLSLVARTTAPAGRQAASWTAAFAYHHLRSRWHRRPQSSLKR
jgi:glycosyltransferase involved in cell wall biosynthesis